MNALRTVFPVLLLLLLAVPADAQRTRGEQSCPACTAPVARLGFSFHSAWAETDEDPPTWSEEITVADIVVDSPAHEGGLESGDVILRVNDLVATSQLFWSVRRTLRPGDTIRLLIERDGTEREIRLVAAPEEER